MAARRRVYNRYNTTDDGVLADGIYGFYCNTAFATGTEASTEGEPVYQYYLIEIPICKVQNGTVYLYGSAPRSTGMEISSVHVNGDRVENRNITFQSTSYRDGALNTMRNDILSSLRNLGYDLMRMAAGTNCLLGELYADDFNKITILGDGNVNDGPSKE